MQIVIDIPEEDYNFIKKQVADGITNPLKMCIANGTPLPAEGQQQSEDFISREEVMKLLEKEDWADTVEGVLALPSVTLQPRWIPVKWHEITEEEREREGYPEEWICHLDCLMPDDGDEILITVKDSKGRRWVEKDTALIDDGNYLDSGYDWIDDVIAWMPLPEPYVPDTDVGEKSESLTGGGR